MEFLDEFESQPRFVFQSKQLPQPTSDLDSDSSSSLLSSLHKPTLFISLLFSIVILSLAFVYFNSEPLKSLLLWLSFSLLIGPFAPPSLTAGDISVGRGPPLKESPKVSTETNEKFSRKSTKTVKKSFEEPPRFDGYVEKSTTVGESVAENQSNRSNASLTETIAEDKSEDDEVDEELLKKLMAKHPVGKPGRWEAIAEGFKGKHKVETIIAKAKEMGERKGSDQDSYKKFLKDRRPVDKRVLDEGGNETSSKLTSQNEEEGRKEIGWSSVEDLALLNALKAFPKDVAMRWEKIASSVPGKTKSACMKRVAELKKDFRSSKGSS